MGKSSYAINRTRLLPFIEERLHSLPGPPEVDLDCIYVRDVETPYSWAYTMSDFSDGGAELSRVKGDGTVPEVSVKVPLEVWQQQATQGSIRLAGYPLELGGTDHMGVPASMEVIDLVKQILTNYSRRPERKP